MSVDTFFDAETNEDWNTEMKRMCNCGHTLLMHAFTMHPRGGNNVMLRVSQCVSCGCKEFGRKKNKDETKTCDNGYCFL